MTMPSRVMASQILKFSIHILIYEVIQDCFFCALSNMNNILGGHETDETCQSQIICSQQNIFKEASDRSQR
jgi:hypothetical protein